MAASRKPRRDGSRRCETFVWLLAPTVFSKVGKYDIYIYTVCIYIYIWIPIQHTSLWDTSLFFLHKHIYIYRVYASLENSIRGVTSPGGGQAGKPLQSGGGLASRGAGAGHFDF